MKESVKRNYHQNAVETFMRERFSHQPWEFALPEGHGHETYFVCNQEEKFFIKLGSLIERYREVASIGLTPPILAAGLLEDGTSIMVQKYIQGRTPTRRDYRNHLVDFASTILKVHQSEEVKNSLNQAPDEMYQTNGRIVLNEIQTRWDKVKSLVPTVASYVDDCIFLLRKKVDKFQGAGLVASHNDICNANWIITKDEKLYLIDLDAMTMDDPALDIGATLWWYYPPELRHKFLDITGYNKDEEFSFRMQIRMAMHCLNIILPRENSFDSFDPDLFSENLTDFKAIMAGEENPQGYYD